MEELIKRLENTRNFVFYCPDDRAAIETAIQYLNQLQEIKEYLELSLTKSDELHKKWDNQFNRSHDSDDLHHSSLFEGMSEAYADLLEKFFKENQ